MLSYTKNKPTMLWLLTMIRICESSLCFMSWIREVANISLEIHISANRTSGPKQLVSDSETLKRKMPLAFNHVFKYIH